MRRKSYFLFYFLLMSVLLVGCGGKDLTYEGATDNWEVKYHINENKENKDDIGMQDVDIQYIGEDSPTTLTFSYVSPTGGSCELYLDLDENGKTSHSPGCLDEKRPDYKDDSFKVSIVWGEHEEKIELKRVN
ncbi:hypothetical protein MKY34_17540 [Sporosarcina sp. FSL K6-1522]|uniref:hypothetical protein n=1 Tax=Sporosarcina sp. FSL K6-1522 TaxID=2921554 RepID=UPI00315B07CA